MKIQLNNTEILAALHQYVGTMGINISGKTLTIEFNQGRKNGLSADISIDDANTPSMDDDDVDSILVGGTIKTEAPAEYPESIDGAQSIFGS